MLLGICSQKRQVAVGQRKIGVRTLWLPGFCWSCISAHNLVLLGPTVHWFSEWNFTFGVPDLPAGDGGTGWAEQLHSRVSRGLLRPKQPRALRSSCCPTGVVYVYAEAQKERREKRIGEGFLVAVTREITVPSCFSRLARVYRAWDLSFALMTARIHGCPLALPS